MTDKPTPKLITINSCAACPHHVDETHSMNPDASDFPYCKLERRRFTFKESQMVNGDFPDWCPLE